MTALAFEVRLVVASNTVEQERPFLLKAKARLEESLRRIPDDTFIPPFDLFMLPLVEAALGNKAEAIRGAEKVVELYPVSRAAPVGRDALRYLAMVYAWTGERDRALETISILVSSPGPWSSPELFRLAPSLDSLRGDPRFAQILAQASKPF